QKGKEFFTIIDFRNVTNLFADPDFDGEPAYVFDPKEPTGGGGEPSGGGEPIEKYRVTDKKVDVLNSTIQVLDENGKLVTE
ncbi:EcoAI/FtnUII family type I restriction enzme subunit R, partial [Streptococcus pyogenes]